MCIRDSYHTVHSRIQMNWESGRRISEYGGKVVRSVSNGLQSVNQFREKVIFRMRMIICLMVLYLLAKTALTIYFLSYYNTQCSLNLDLWLVFSIIIDTLSLGAVALVPCCMWNMNRLSYTLLNFIAPSM
eukprot:TRINITY_DN0_c6156_g1_i1.p1 TRINITY_DN0_c6156_g1~~TRINITY_DN0_c6156_g1_i1.p1  ORF type:complete len:130 (+),score=13.59 TRINITY_DN0_c6156_g1_i1:1-390(+)